MGLKLMTLRSRVTSSTDWASQAPLFHLPLKQPWARKVYRFLLASLRKNWVWGRLAHGAGCWLSQTGFSISWLLHHMVPDFWPRGLGWKMSPERAPSGVFSFKFYTGNTRKNLIHTQGILHLKGPCSTLFNNGNIWSAWVAHLVKCLQLRSW